MEEGLEPNRMLVEFQKKNIHTDLVVRCRNGSLQCHRALISLCFPWPLPEDLDSLILPDMDFDLFQERIESFYLTLMPSKITEILYRTFKKELLGDQSKVSQKLDETDPDQLGECTEMSEEIWSLPEVDKLDSPQSECSKYLLQCPTFYPCDQCDSCFDTSAQLDDHRTAHKHDRGYRCDQCLLVCESKVSLKKHMISHASLKCSICDAEFQSTEDLSEHRRNHKPAKAKESCPCDLCGKILGSRYLLNRHKTRIHLKPEGFPCEYCDYKTSNNKNLRRHIEYSHLGIKYECAVCGEFFASKSSLYMHQNVHSDERPFICTECGDSFKWKKNLESHMHNKHSKMMFPCGQCGREFKSQNYLEYHLKSHDTNQQFPCEECGKRFVTKTKLRMHQNIHTGEKPYRCPNLMCEKSYHSSDQLSHHKKNCLKVQDVLKVDRQDSPTTTILWSM